MKTHRWARVPVAVFCAAGTVVAMSAGVGVAAPLAPPPSLKASFDNIGITAPGAASAGNFDGDGDSYSSTALAADGLQAGSTLLHDGLSIQWPYAPPGADDNVVADGQTIRLSGIGNTLGIVASSAYSAPNGVSGTFTVNYQDGTHTTGTIDFADWADNTAAAGTDVFATGEGQGSGLTAPVSLYYASLPISPDEAVASVSLPTIGSAVGVDVPSLHVFDLTLGTAGANAAGAPGALSYYDQGRKDCVGTAANQESKVWYTVADGTLSDVYSPTIDNTDVKSLDPIVTGNANGNAFTVLQPRDMTYTVSELGTTGMACRVVALDKALGFAVVTDFVTDPGSDSVVMQYSLVTFGKAASNLHVYLRFNPLLNGHGGGGAQNAGGESATIDDTWSNGQIPVSYSTNSFTEAVNRSYATPIYAALAASRPFAEVESGYVGSATDGVTELDNAHALTAGPSAAPDTDNGNVAQTVELSLSGSAGGDLGHGPVPAYYAPGYTSGGGARGCSTGAQPASGSSEVTTAGIASSVAAASGQAVNASEISAVTVSLGFGEDEGTAVGSAIASSVVPFATTFNEYQSQWERYDSTLCAPPASVSNLSTSTVQQAYWLSANVIKASEDKTFLGATVASLASPWGQAVPAGNAAGGLATYFGSYREVFPRDAYETFTGFMADGDLATARQMVYHWFDDMQLPNGSFPRNGLLNGLAAPDTGGLQLDETADPILAAWEAGLAGDATLYQDHIKPAAYFLVANGPSDGVERWEEQTGYSPSTMADEVAGLVAAANIAAVQGDTTSERVFDATADDFRNLVLQTDVTTNGPLSSSPYFIRVDKDGDPNSVYDYTLGNGNDNSVDQRTVIDQGFLELTRLGELSADTSIVQNSLAVAAKTIDVATPMGPGSTTTGLGVLRYNGDGYGDCYTATPPDGSPSNTNCPGSGVPWAVDDEGTGHPWPVLTGENAEYQIEAGNTANATSDLDFMLDTASGVGLVPEQVWDDPALAASPYPADPATGAGVDPASLDGSSSIGFVPGEADGSAAPLTWAQAQELRLIVDLGSGKIVDQPSIVTSRYASVAASSTPTLTVPLSITSPTSISEPVGGAPAVPADLTVNQTSTTVAGTTSPGATVDVVVTTPPAQPGGAPTTTVTTLTADGSGNFSTAVTLPSGTTSVEVATTTAAGTNEALMSITNVYVAGTVVLTAPAAADGGFGPGTYAYPTAPDTFPPDMFRLTGTAFTVINSGSGSGATTTFEVNVGNVNDAFSEIGGQQIVDVYISAPSGSVPAGELTSTASAFPTTSSADNGAGGSDNYTIAQADAWNQLIQISPFGAEWVTPNSNTASEGLPGSTFLGSPSFSWTQFAPVANGDTPGLLQITVPDATLGTPGPGWTFVVTLQAQGGTNLNGNPTDPANYAFPRSFDATEGSYNPGVCSYAVATGSSPPAICSANPSTVPNVFDTIPPAGVTVQGELAEANWPPALQGVTVP